MFEINKNYINQHIDILSFRDLAPSTIDTYTSYMTQFIDWTESVLSGKILSDISWAELRSYIRYLKEVRQLNPRTVNVHIAQLRDFYQYILHRDWDRYQIPYLHYDELLPLVPTREEVNTIIDSIHNLKHKVELALLYSSGIRVSELCRLRCVDIYHSKNSIYISKSKNRFFHHIFVNSIRLPKKRTGFFLDRRRTLTFVPNLFTILLKNSCLY